MIYTLGELFNIKDPLKVCHPRVDKRLNCNAKEFVISEDKTAGDKVHIKSNNNNNSRKCKGVRCSNQPKRGCDFDMCGRCCKKISEPCSVHEDFSVFEPPVFHRNYSLMKIEPKGFFRFVLESFYSNCHTTTFTKLKLSLLGGYLLKPNPQDYHSIGSHPSISPLFFYLSIIDHKK